MILIHYKKGGGVAIKPLGYPEGVCHEATAPYENVRIGEKQVVEGQAEAAEIQLAVPAAQLQRLGG